MKNHKNFYINYIFLSLCATIGSFILFSRPEADLSMENLANISDKTVDYMTLQQNSMFLRIGTAALALLMLVLAIITVAIVKKITPAHLLYNYKSALLFGLVTTGLCILICSLLTNLAYAGYQFAIHLPIIIRAFRKV